MVNALRLFGMWALLGLALWLLVYGLYAIHPGLLMVALAPLVVIAAAEVSP